MCIRDRQQSDLKGLLLRSNKAAFIVGADITEFLSLFLVPEEQLSQWLHFALSLIHICPPIFRQDTTCPALLIELTICAFLCTGPVSYTHLHCE